MIPDFADKQRQNDACACRPVRAVGVGRGCSLRRGGASGRVLTVYAQKRRDEQEIVGERGRGGGQRKRTEGPRRFRRPRPSDNKVNSMAQPAECGLRCVHAGGSERGGTRILSFYYKCVAEELLASEVGSEKKVRATFCCLSSTALEATVATVRVRPSQPLGTLPEFRGGY